MPRLAQADKLKVTVRYEDGHTHFAYTTALRTLCGHQLITKGSWKFSMQLDPPTCFTCRRIAQKWLNQRLIRPFPFELAVAL